MGIARAHAGVGAGVRGEKEKGGLGARLEEEGGVGAGPGGVGRGEKAGSAGPDGPGREKGTGRPNGRNRLSPTKGRSKMRKGPKTEKGEIQT